jgi:hypothetical protein
MDYRDIRQSLHYGTYIEQSRGLKLAADENLKLFLLSNDDTPTERNESKGVGLLNSTMLLYAISIELIIKARGLYEERDSIINGDIKNFGEFMKKWGGNKDGHNFFKIIDFYKIEISDIDNKIFDELKSFAIWAGRFPFPRREEDIVLFESGKGKRGSLGEDYAKEIDRFISNQVKEMTQ